LLSKNKNTNNKISSNNKIPINIKEKKIIQNKINDDLFFLNDNFTEELIDNHFINYKNADKLKFL